MHSYKQYKARKRAVKKFEQLFLVYILTVPRVKLSKKEITL